MKNVLFCLMFSICFYGFSQQGALTIENNTNCSIDYTLASGANHCDYDDDSDALFLAANSSITYTNPSDVPGLNATSNDYWFRMKLGLDDGDGNCFEGDLNPQQNSSCFTGGPAHLVFDCTCGDQSFVIIQWNTDGTIVIQ